MSGIRNNEALFEFALGEGKIFVLFEEKHTHKPHTTSLVFRAEPEGQPAARLPVLRFLSPFEALSSRVGVAPPSLFGSFAVELAVDKHKREAAVCVMDSLLTF